jgi:cytidylate kinase
MLVKTSLKEKEQKKQKNLSEILEKQERREDEKAGGFQKIYPIDLAAISQKYQSILSSSSTTPE